LLHEEPDRPAQARRGVDSCHHESKVVHEQTPAAGSSHALLLLSAAGAVLLLTVVLGVYLIRRNKAPKYDLVIVNTPEEQHVSVMQFNGYENPTYRHFEKA